MIFIYSNTEEKHTKNSINHFVNQNKESTAQISSDLGYAAKKGVYLSCQRAEFTLHVNLQSVHFADERTVSGNP